MPGSSASATRRRAPRCRFARSALKPSTWRPRCPQAQSGRARPSEDFDDAIRLANGVKFGLSASIVSNNLSRVHQFIQRIEAGLITVNLPTAGVEYQLPFGGTKASSFGMREQGQLALDFYTESRTVYLKHTA